MIDYNLKLFWPEIYLSYTKVGYTYPKTGIDFLDNDYWSNVSLQ